MVSLKDILNDEYESLLQDGRVSKLFGYRLCDLSKDDLIVGLMLIGQEIEQQKKFAEQEREMHKLFDLKINERG